MIPRSQPTGGSGWIYFFIKPLWLGAGSAVIFASVAKIKWEI